MQSEEAQNLDLGSRQTATTGEHSFDELAIELADNTLTRGRALKLMCATLLGGLGAIVGTSVFVDDADAKKKKKKKKHRGGLTTCSLVEGCATAPCQCPKGKHCNDTKSGGSVCAPKGVIVD
jgi:hypothetical protein